MPAWTRLAVALLFLSLPGLTGFGAPTLGLQLVKVPVALVGDIERSGVELIRDHFSHPDFIVGYVERKDLPSIPVLVRAQMEELDEIGWATGEYDRVTFRRTRSARKDFYAGYHDYTQLTDELKRLAAAHPGLVRLETAGKSVQGRELWYVVVSDNAAVEEPEPKFLYHANMHGDEVVGRELMIYFLQYLMDQYGKDSRVTQLVDHAQIFIMPSMNPDGFELRTRANARGKDLNRNFPDRFDSPSDTPAGREIEVQDMMNLAARHHFVYGLNWHGGEICFNLPWGNIKNDKPANKYGDDAFFNPIGREYTQLNRPMYANHQANFDHGLTYGYEWYPVNGGINDWFNFFRRSVHSVVELTVTKWPSAATLAGHWDDNREAMLTYLWRGLRGVHLEVRDERWNLVPSPQIAVSTSPARPLTYDDGYIHRLTGDGAQQVTISAAGFEPRTLSLTATYFDGQYTPVLLKRR
jgi:hypothetical protein